MKLYNELLHITYQFDSCNMFQLAPQKMFQLTPLGGATDQMDRRHISFTISFRFWCINIT